MIAMISPAFDAYSESLSTLKFATRAKKIKNRAKINEDLDQRALLRKYEQELKKLRKQLESKTGGSGDPEEVQQLEFARRQAEEDKNAAINALEARSVEYMREKEERRRLEEKIKELSSNVLVGGQHIEETP